MASRFPLAAMTAPDWMAMAIWGAVIIVAILLLGFGLLWARKYAFRSMKGLPGQDTQLTIERLEEMYRSGQISREEFSTLRRGVLGLGPDGPPKEGKPSPGAEEPTGGSQADPPEAGLTPRPPDVDENKKNPPPGEDPAAP